jgi:hypothetical protein
MLDDAAAEDAAAAVEDLVLALELEHATKDVAITPASNAEKNFFIIIHFLLSV